MRSWLGSGGKSVISGDLMIRSRSTFTGNGSLVAPAFTSNICPALTFRVWRGYFTKARRAAPSKTINLLLPKRVDSKINVVPVIPTVTAFVLNSPPPESFGTCTRIEPLPSCPLRPALLKLKIVFAPRRVIVKSSKVSSERDSSPVRTAVFSLTWSFSAAGRGGASDRRSLTSRII
jgi:hypothetical protein